MLCPHHSSRRPSIPQTPGRWHAGCYFYDMSSIGKSTPDTFLQTLERLLAIPNADLVNALNQACNAVGDALHADKVDAFLYDDSRDCLVAFGASSTPLSRLQRKLGLDVLPVSNGGRSVQVFQTGEPFVTGRLQDDPEEVRGLKEGLKIQSELGVPLQVGHRRQGMLMIASLQPDFYTTDDLEFAQSVARWVGMIAHRAELAEEITKKAVEEEQRKVAEELITVLAHDLRNYISPISAHLHVIRTRAQQEKRTEDLRNADRALQGVKRLSHLITDILDVARLEQGIFQMDMEPLDLYEVTRDIASNLSTPEHDVIVNTDDKPIVTADPRRIRQCLENVISNAVQHSPAEAPVQLLVHTELWNGKSWGTVEVHNEGPGIPVEFIPQIFDRFTAGKGSPGLGLGLYLAKRIAAAHDGDLTVESPTGKGTRFWLRLPEAGR